MTLEKPTMSERACANCKGFADSRETPDQTKPAATVGPRHDQT